MEVYSEGAYLSWDGTPESVAEYDPESRKLVPVLLSEQTEHQDGYSAFVVENAYKNEIREFFKVVDGIAPAQYGFEQDLEVLKVIDMIGA